MRPKGITSGTPRHACRCGFLAILLGAALPQPSGYAQSSNQLSTASPADWASVAKKSPLMTYDDGINLKDGYKVPPVAYAGKNFLECDKSLVLVDEAKLKVAKTADCGDGGGDWKGVLAAYINAIGANGDVHLITPRGHQVIAKYKWDELVKSVSPATGSNTKVDVKVGDFAAFTKDDKGHFATMFKLAPDTSSDSHQM